MSPECKRYSSLFLDTRRKECRADGILSPAAIGNWMFYVSDRHEKFFYARAGRIDCLHKSNPFIRPWYKRLRQIGSVDRYSRTQWRQSLATPLPLRLAEVWIASERLWRAGLGPRPGAVIVVARFVRDGCDLGSTMGFQTVNAHSLPERAPVTENEMVAADVRPDLSRGCLRQQINGYVVDLCSVAGVTPIDATEEVNHLADRLHHLMHLN